MRPSVHVDLIGSFRPEMREADDAAISAGPLFIDTPDALAESGDLSQPLGDGTLTSDDIRATLAELCRGSAQAEAETRKSLCSSRSAQR